MSNESEGYIRLQNARETDDAWDPHPPPPYPPFLRLSQAKLRGGPERLGWLVPGNAARRAMHEGYSRSPPPDTPPLARGRATCRTLAWVTKVYHRSISLSSPRSCRFRSNMAARGLRRARFYAPAWPSSPSAPRRPPAAPRKAPSPSPQPLRRTSGRYSRCANTTPYACFKAPLVSS